MTTPIDHTHPAVSALMTLGAPLAAAVAIVTTHDPRDMPRSPVDVAHAAGVSTTRPPAWCRRVAAALDLGRQWIRLAPFRAVVTEPTSAAETIRPYLAHADAEQFAVAMLNARRRVLGVEIVHRGTVAQVDVHPREVFRPAIRVGAHSIVVAHNHPSGDPAPSDMDVSLTHRLVQCGEAIGIPVVDSIVITAERHASMLELGLMV